MYGRWIKIVVQLAIGLVAVGALFMAIPILRARLSTHDANTTPAVGSAGEPKLVGTQTIRLEPEAVQALGIRTGKVEQAQHKRGLPPMLGSIALDPNEVARVQTRFGGEVVEFGTTSDSSAVGYRPLGYGDVVKAGDLLAVLWSKDLGEKKSDLVDARSQWKLDRDALERIKAVYDKGGIPEGRLRDAERALAASKIAVSKAERTLRVWRVSEEEIKALTDDTGPTSGSRDPATEKSWARVEIRAPINGTILEKNINKGEVVNDPTRDLYKIANLSKLKVWAYASQEDLPLLTALPKPIRWTIHLRTEANATEPGTVEHISELVDTNQRAVLLMGSIDNPKGNLRAGQLISAEIEIPSPPGTLEVPTAALVEDGEESVVFLQPRANEPEYQLCPVRVLRRYRDVIMVQTASPGAPLAAGATVVTSGAVELRTIVENLQNASANPSERH